MAAVQVAETEVAPAPVAAEPKVDAEMPAADAAEAPKRKEPETDSAVAEPEAKKQKAEDGAVAKPAVVAKPVDAAVVKKQVEYYMSDDNLRHDKFFHEKIATDAEGWMEMSLILSCNKMKAMRATREDVLLALKGSTLELKDGGSHVRRPGNAPLPQLEAKPVHRGKNQVQTHAGGVIGVFRNVPAEQSWVQIKEKLSAHIGTKAKLWHVSEVNDKSQCFFVCAPFDGDMAFFTESELEMEGAKLKVEICYGDLVQSYLRTMPKFIREKREKELRRRQKERNQPFIIGTQKFSSIGALRGKVKEILNSRSDGEALKPEGTDFKLVRALMEFHPRGEEKTKDVVGIKVQPATLGENRCFWIVRADETSEDISTALHFAAANGHARAATVFLDKDPICANALDDNGCTAMQLALDAEHQEVADLLEPYTCEVDMAALFGPSQELFKVDSGPDFVPLNEMSPIKLRSAHQHLVLRAGDQGIGYYMDDGLVEVLTMPTVNSILSEQAEVAKILGNRLLKAAKLEAAEDAYTEAISLDPSVYTYWNNRAMCKMKRSNAEGALKDAMMAKKLAPNMAKVRWRCATAMDALEMHLEAAGEYFEAYKLDKDNKETRAAFETAIKKVKQM